MTKILRIRAVNPLHFSLYNEGQNNTKGFIATVTADVAPSRSSLYIRDGLTTDNTRTFEDFWENVQSLPAPSAIRATVRISEVNGKFFFSIQRNYLLPTVSQYRTSGGYPRVLGRYGTRTNIGIFDGRIWIPRVDSFSATPSFSWRES